MFRIFIYLLLAAILTSLSGALIALLQGRDDDREAGMRMVRQLTWRIVLSILLFLILLLGFTLGWLPPRY